jgi:gluconokinase
MSRAIILMGVSGSGKTTIGQKLSFASGWSFYDGDDYHSPENVEKMSRGIPLNDDDRLFWLETLSELILEKRSSGEDLILACSALKRAYRQTLLSKNRDLLFVFLEGDFDLIWQRMKKRKTHYMKPDMLKSQFAILEPPLNALTLSVERPAAELVAEILNFAGIVTSDQSNTD